MPKKKPKWVFQDYVTVVQLPLGAYSGTEGPKIESDDAHETHHYAGLFDVATIRLDPEYVIVTVASLAGLITRIQRLEREQAVVKILHEGDEVASRGTRKPRKSK